MAKKFIIITSIFPPTDAVKKFATMEGWQLIVVGDKKSPSSWAHDNVVYLSPEEQNKLGYKILDHLPWNHYCRKMVGYLYAIQQGAEVIFDTDDDNEPKSNWPSIPAADSLKTLSGNKFINIYEYFTDKFIWPRGYPLDHILEKVGATESMQANKVGIWQFLADEEPDVDAIYRLTRNEPIFFDPGEPIVLSQGTVCPFNSQNTQFSKKDIFPLLYLPAFVTFRFTDILRGLVAQPILWQNGYRLGFGPATVIQKRNPHNYLQDFESEVPVYLNSEKVVDIVTEALVSESNNLAEQLQSAYLKLRGIELVSDKEIRLLDAWLNDLKTLSVS